MVKIVHVKRHARRTLLGSGMSSVGKARDVEQSDREYIKQQQQRFKRATASKRVTVSKSDISRFADMWPASGLRGKGPITFEFDHHGNLVDMEPHPEELESQGADPAALSALADDARDGIRGEER